MVRQLRQQRDRGLDGQQLELDAQARDVCLREPQVRTATVREPCQGLYARPRVVRDADDRLQRHPHLAIGQCDLDPSARGEQVGR